MALRGRARSCSVVVYRALDDFSMLKPLRLCETSLGILSENQKDDSHRET